MPNASEKKIFQFIVSLLVPFLAVLPTAWVASPDTAWFKSLHQPFFAPPNWLFGPVWTLLYLLMGYALYKLWRAKRSVARSRTLKLWTIQLIVNSAWTPVFFGLQEIGWALVVILLLDILILWLIITVRPVSKTALWCLVPYAAWIAFATILNATLLFLN